MMELRINRDRLKIITQLGPGVFWLVFFFVIPILLILTYSFYQFSDGVMQKTFTMENPFITKKVIFWIAVFRASEIASNKYYK